MLSPHQVQELRCKVQFAHRQPFRGPNRLVRCVDGPLAGLPIRIRLDVYRQPETVFGWCQLTERGPVIAYYVSTAKADEWRFRGFDRVGHRESGHLP